MIVYIKFEIELHRLNVKNQADLDVLKWKIEKAMMSVHTNTEFDSDVVVSIVEKAGDIDADA